MGVHDDITIYIPSLNRAGRVITLASLSEDAKAHTHVVVRADQMKDYESCGVSVLPEPAHCKHIGHCRQWIIETCPTKYLMMLDDDLSFSIRPVFGDWHLWQLPKDGWDGMMDVLMQKVHEENLAHASVAFREKSNVCLDDWQYNQRYSRLFIYDLEQFRELGVELGRMVVMEDFDIALQLIEKGRPSAICFAFAQGQAMSGADGGCSTYRTLQVQNEGANRLKELHPDFVKTVQKTTKMAWGGATRTDVIISWKKAYERGLEWRKANATAIS